jgi:hypothetical protein
MTQSCCECPACRAAIRAEILRIFDDQNRWMGPWTIRSYGLAWVPLGLYREILREMTREGDGCLILSYQDDDPFPRLLPAMLMRRPSPITREVAP